MEKLLVIFCAYRHPFWGVFLRLGGIHLKNYRKRLEQALLHEMPNHLRQKIKAHLTCEETREDEFIQIINMLRSRRKLTTSRESIDWHPRIDLQKCTRCDICHDKCPKGVYIIENGQLIVKHPSYCVLLCSKCMKNCPEGAIQFPDKEAYRHYIIYT